MPNVQTAWSAKGNNYSNLYQNAPADPMGFITIKLVAKVTSVIDYDNLLKGVMKVNDTITGEYVYDSGTLDTYSDPSIGHYEYTSSSFGFEVKAGGLVFKTNPSDVEFSIWIYNSVFYGSDEFIVLSSNNLQLSNGMLVTFIQWHLVDDNGTAIDSDALLTKAPVLADWKSSNTLMLGGKDPSDPNKAYMITAKVTRATKSKSVDTYDVKSELRTSSLTIPNQYNILFTQYMVKLFERLSHSFPVLRYLFGN